MIAFHVYVYDSSVCVWNMCVFADIRRASGCARFGGGASICTKMGELYIFNGDIPYIRILRWLAGRQCKTGKGS